MSESGGPRSCSVWLLCLSKHILETRSPTNGLQPSRHWAGFSKSWNTPHICNTYISSINLLLFILAPIGIAHFKLAKTFKRCYTDFLYIFKNYQNGINMKGIMKHEHPFSSYTMLLLHDSIISHLFPDCF